MQSALDTRLPFSEVMFWEGGWQTRWQLRLQLQQQTNKSSKYHLTLFCNDKFSLFSVLNNEWMNKMQFFIDIE